MCKPDPVLAEPEAGAPEGINREFYDAAIAFADDWVERWRNSLEAGGAGDTEELVIGLISLMGGRSDGSNAAAHVVPEHLPSGD